MGLYSEMLPDDTILSRARKHRRILMLTCPGCACESVSYAKGLPCRALEAGKDMEQSARAIHLLRDEWSERFAALGIEVSHITAAFPCEFFDDERDRVLQAARDARADAVAVLACSSGAVALADIMRDEGVDIIPMMKTAGSFVFRLVPDESGDYSIVDRDSARILRFK